ncbi:MAG: hypothetical protein KC431_31880, partial [Myxococcales bacterium]|nr:hypothetical protein [Myxococcales bacterium]
MRQPLATVVPVFLFAGILAATAACTNKGQPAGEDGPKPTNTGDQPETPPAETPPTETPPAETPPVETPPADPPKTPTAAEGQSWDVLRLDSASFEQTRLGRIHIDATPPFTVTLEDGGDELRTLVEEANALGDFTYYGGSPVKRAEDPRWLDFLRREWVGEKHGLVLRVPSVTPTTSRWRLMVVEDGKQLSLGTLEMNDVGYLRVIEAPAEHHEQLRTLLDRINSQDNEGIEIAPPLGERGMWGKAIPRGTPDFFVMMRRGLYEDGALLVPEARGVEQPVTVVENRGIAVRVPNGLFPAEVEYPTILSMSGAPGGPLGLLLVEYDDIPDEDAALLAHVKTLYGHDPHFEAGPATMVEIGGQRWRAATCRTGAELTHATNLVVLWSKSLE